MIIAKIQQGSIEYNKLGKNISVIILEVGNINVPFSPYSAIVKRLHRITLIIKYISIMMSKRFI